MFVVRHGGYEPYKYNGSQREQKSARLPYTLYMLVALHADNEGVCLFLFCVARGDGLDEVFLNGDDHAVRDFNIDGRFGYIVDFAVDAARA